MTRFDGANSAWQLPGDFKLVRAVAEDSDAAVFVELRDRRNRPVNVKAILGPRWKVGQQTRNGAVSGTAIALRRGGKVKRRPLLALLRLVQINQAGRKVQARYLRTMPVTVDGLPAMLFVVHLPLESTGKQAEAVRVVSDEWRRTSGRKLLFADCNMSPARFAEEIGAPHHAGNGVMVWAWSDGWDDVRVTWRNVKGSDHAVGTLRA